MNSDSVERRLAAILSADAVGYSRLMAEDEGATIRTVGDYREQISVLVRQHRGRVVDASGDNLLAEFPAALDAVRCALEIQSVIRVRNEALAAERRMEFRIGVHLGDIAVEGERVYGDGVNIAARLEGLAEPGGICISGPVHDQVHRRVEADFRDLGSQKVKNVPDAVRVYRVGPGSGAAGAPRPRPGLRAGLAAALVVMGVGSWMLWRGTSDSARPGTIDDRPAIAVLPFDNLSGDPEQEYFADGLSEDLTTRLASVGQYPVIARNSSFTFKGRAVEVKQVGRALGARYVVEGSVQRVAGRVRINAQLIDATTGRHLWAETYDRELHDIFDVQDEITRAIVAATHGEIMASEMRRAMATDPESLGAWDTSLQGFWHLRKQTREENQEARRLFEKAIEIDPSSAAGFQGLAATHYFDLIRQWTESPEESVEALMAGARRAVELDPGDARAHVTLCTAYSVVGEREKMLAAGERAIALNPSLPMAYVCVAAVRGTSGHPDEAIEMIENAMRLSPVDPDAWVFLDALANLYFAAGRYDEAIETCERTVEQVPGHAYGYLVIAASNGHLGRLDAARDALDSGLRLQPELSGSALRRAYSFASPEFLESFVAGLRKAGWEG